jgi:tRNA U34 5-carboxymethylaminomethyl modifying GTPase MnmE/TrmE
MARQNEYDIKDALKLCKRAASNGYRIASRQADNLNSTLIDAENKVQYTVEEFNTSPMYDSEATDLLEQQLLDIRSTFNKLSVTFNEDLYTLQQNLSKFSITLFGRTMAGKSTLMEVLTHGDGKTIGTGAQRTTRDVRKYKWNSLEITDVPGIGAFEGQEDETLAFEAAKSADLILFLITDDAPQAVDAECFGRIINLGKPVLCIINVKVAVSDEDDLDLALWDIKDRFDFDRLNTIKEEFLSYGEKLGQEWRRIPFVYVHLQAAFFAQKTADKKAADAFYDISRMDFLKKQIINQVRDKGEFYRIKTFIDAVSTPTLESEETLLRQSLLNSAQGRTILSKRRKLADWKDKFYRDGSNQINSAIISVRSQLYSELAAFAEDHFADEHADKAWNELLKKLGVTQSCQTTLENLEAQANDKIKEISREINNEIKFDSLFTEDNALRMHKIIDGKKVWNWGSLIISGGLSIGAGISYLVGATLAGPLGWAAIAVTAIGIIGARFFKSRDKQEYEARRKLEESLKKNVEKICKVLKPQMMKNFNLLIDKRIEKLIIEMDRMNSVIFKLSDTQKELAWKLNNRLLELNKQIVTEAIKLIGAEGLEWWIMEVSRIPGNTVLLQLDDGKKFPEEQKMQLHRLMSEFVGFVYYAEDEKVFISRVMGKSIDRKQINVEDKIGVAHIPIDDSDPNILNRARLAQQLTQLVITK